MLLIITNSFDMTTDLLVEKLPSSALFRFNVDLIRSYGIRFSNEGFERFPIRPDA
jgi:hypothetical protein